MTSIQIIKLVGFFFCTMGLIIAIVPLVMDLARYGATDRTVLFPIGAGLFLLGFGVWLMNVVPGSPV